MAQATPAGTREGAGASGGGSHLRTLRVSTERMRRIRAVSCMDSREMFNGMSELSTTPARGRRRSHGHTHGNSSGERKCRYA